MKNVNREFILNILRVFTGNLAASTIIFLTLPIISRLYSPSDFGQAFYFISLTAVAASVSSLRYDASIVIASKSKLASIMAINSTIICFITSTLFGFICFIMNSYQSRFLSPFSEFIYLLPVTIFLTGLCQIILSIFTREKEFGAVAGFNISKSAVQQTYRIFFGIAGFASGISLITGLIAGQILGIVFVGKRLVNIFKNLLTKQITLKDLIFGLKRYKNFPIYSSWSYFMNILGFQLPVLLLGYYFDIEKVGHFSMAVMVLSFPTALTNSIGRVLYQQAAEKKNAGDLKQFVWEVYKRLTTYAALPFMLCMLYGQTILSYLFGSSWNDAGLFSQILALLYFVIFCTSPLGNLYNIQERQRENSYFIMARLAMQFCGLVVGGLFNNIILSLLWFASAGLIIRYSSVSWIMSTIGIRAKESLLWILKSTLLSALPLIVWKLFCQFRTVSLMTHVSVIVIIFIFHYYIVFRNESQLNLLFEK